MPDAGVPRPPVRTLVLVPALITLAVTLLRLTGELLHWSPLLFNRAAGGGGALVGIAWLVPVFGVYFGVKLAGAGLDTRRSWGPVGLVLLAIAALPLAGLAASRLGLSGRSPWMLLVFALASAVSVGLGVSAWPALGRTLLVYAFAARMPVMLVMLAAILGNWGTHYDAPPPDLSAMAPVAKWLLIGVVPQMTVWIAYTVALGALFGLPAGLVVARRRRAAGA
jgi:hypothetical protein